MYTYKNICVKCLYKQNCFKFSRYFYGHICRYRCLWLKNLKIKIIIVIQSRRLKFDKNKSKQEKKNHNNKNQKNTNVNVYCALNKYVSECASLIQTKIMKTKNISNIIIMFNLKLYL